jgi:glycosyltransferase involved in cell wall biosynthesis
MISVIIPTADRPGPLHRALRSLARQVFRDFEVIVVRDGGRPARSVVDSWSSDLRVTLLDVNPRQGVSHARNVGLARAAGEYVAFLDDDDIYLPQHLQAAHRVLAGSCADAVYGGALVSPRWIEAVPRSATALPRKDYPFDHCYLMVANYIHTGSVVTRNFASSTVRFDEEMSHCEDWDMWLALRRDLRYRFAFLGQCTCVYHQVPRAAGVVSAAYLTSPTPFTLARARLFDKWPTADALVTDYRGWFRRFDDRLDSRIERGEAVPPHIYEHAVRKLHAGFTAGAPADAALLDTLLPNGPSPLPAASLARAMLEHDSGRHPRGLSHASG